MANRLIRRAHRAVLMMRAECQTLKSGNQALRETAALLTRELEDTYQALEAAEEAEQDSQRRLDVQWRHASVASLACQHAKEECKTLKSGNQALRETVALLTRELEDTYEALKTKEEGGDEVQRNLEEQNKENKVLKQKLANQEKELHEQSRILEHKALQLRASEERGGKLEEQLKRAKEIIGKQNDKKARLDEELAKKNKNLEQKEKQRQKLEQENVGLVEQLKEVKQTFESQKSQQEGHLAEKELKIQQKEKELQDSEQEKINLRQQQMEAKQGHDVQRAYLELKLSGMSKDLHQTEQQLKESQDMKALVEEKLKEGNQLKDNLEGQLAEKNKYLQEKLQQLQKSEEEIGNLDRQLKNTKIDLAFLSAEKIVEEVKGDCTIVGERIKEQTEKKRKRDDDPPEDDRDSTLNNSRSAVEEEGEYQEKRIKLEYAEKAPSEESLYINPEPGCSSWASQGARQETTTLEVKKEMKEQADEKFKFVMEVIQPGLNHIKGDPRTSSKVIEAIQFLEEEAGGRLREHIKPKQEDSSGPKGEYFEDHKNFLV